MLAVLMVLSFLWCGPNEAICEDGFLIHYSCDAAEAWLRAGLRPGQELHIQKCEAYSGWPPED